MPETINTRLRDHKTDKPVTVAELRRLLARYPGRSTVAIGRDLISIKLPPSHNRPGVFFLDDPPPPKQPASATTTDEYPEPDPNCVLCGGDGYVSRETAQRYGRIPTDTSCPECMSR